jgi:hypothetical protein
MYHFGKQEAYLSWVTDYLEFGQVGRRWRVMKDAYGNGTKKRISP